MGEPAKYMIAAIAAVEGEDESEGVCLAIRLCNSANYETTEPLIRSMCRQIRSRRITFANAKPREIENMLDWKIFSTDPGPNGWPEFLYFWERMLKSK